MQKSDNNHQAVKIHRKVQNSTTLNRKYVQKPNQKDKGSEVEIAVKRNAKIQHFDVAPMQTEQISPDKTARKIQIQDEQPIAPAQPHPIQTAANQRIQRQKQARAQAAPKLSAKQLKDQAIQKALASSSRTIDRAVAKENKKQQKAKLHFSIGRVVLALSCAAAAVMAIVYFVGLNMPDISMRVAAIQTGIEASYPSYVPRGFNLSDLSSEAGKVTLNFQNSETGGAFSLSEENSSWDSNALLNNFVKSEYRDNYSIVREQGLTIYVSDSDAAWVNGGVVYKLKTTQGELTKKQIRSIAVSL